MGQRLLSATDIYGEMGMDEKLSFFIASTMWICFPKSTNEVFNVRPGWSSPNILFLLFIIRLSLLKTDLP